MTHFDVIIIGAGPAGLKCAEILGKSNLGVLLVEKNNTIGSKICAGGLTKKSVNYLQLPADLLDFQDSKIKLHVNNQYARIKQLDNFIYTVDRQKLGQWQLAKLKFYKNIVVRTSALVIDITKDYVIVNQEKIYYKFLVGADGANSLVRKYLGLETKKICTAIQYIIPKKYPELEIFYDNHLFSAWYAWIFPHKEYTSIGCGGNPKIISPGKLKQNFELWLKEKKINVSQARYEALILNYDYQGWRFNHIFLVGDAAGLVFSLTGEGIYPAIISGAEAAKTILNPSHQSTLMPQLIKTKNMQDEIVNFLIKCGRFRQVVYYLGLHLFKTNYFQKKLINLTA